VAILSTRVEFVGDGEAADGERHRISAEEVATEWVKWTARIPARVAVAMASHETNLTLNERDTEQHDDSSTVVTEGIFQLQRSEAVRALLPTADLMTLADSCQILAYLLEGYLDSIISVANDAYANGLGKAPLDGDGNPIDDVWAFVAVTHNAGPGSATAGVGSRGTLPGIAHLGLSWPSAWTQAHPSLTRQVAYGSDAITGGPDWSAALDAIQAAPGASPGFGGRALVLLLVVLAVGFIALRAMGEA
jgi:hypothetical protein